MPSLERGQGGGKMHEAIVSKISAATYRIYCRRRHFAPNWNFASQNGCDGSWRSGYVMETTPVVLMLSSTQRDFFPENWSYDVCMMTKWNANEFETLPLAVVIGFATTLLFSPKCLSTARRFITSGIHWMFAFARSLAAAKVTQW